MKGPILCLVGPPGVGKTSLGKSVARATGRNFVRMSLGGVRDEAEIRGHRRTYIGSMPGKIIQGMKKAKIVEPAVPARRGRQARRRLARRSVLGAAGGARSGAERDLQRPLPRSRLRPVGRDVRHDGQHLRMPQPLLDRMEIIRIPGYTEDEKVEIAKRHLIPKQIEAHGLKKTEWTHQRRRAARPHPLLHARGRRAQPRARDRQPDAQGDQGHPDEEDRAGRRHPAQPREVCRRRRFRFGEAEGEDLVGVTTGLAWTEVGGELLTIEAVTLPGKGRVTATGKLGDVMKESVQAAESFVKSRSHAFGIRPTMFEKRDIHVHVPGGRDAQGRAFGRASPWSPRSSSVLTGIPVTARRRDDRRDHAARPRAADRRPQGKAAGGVARRAQDRADPAGQREGSRRDPRQREARS